MVRDIIDLQYPLSDVSESIQVLAAPVTKAVAPANGIQINNAFACKDNTLTVVIAKTDTGISNLIVKKGIYPNSALGDLIYSAAGARTIVLKIENPSRFEQADGSLQLDFATGFAGTIYAFGKKAGLA